jgi:hypothetical protein
MAYPTSRQLKIIFPLARLVLALGAIALWPRSAFGQTVDNDSLAEAGVFHQLKAAIVANDRRAVAALFVYPFRVNRTATHHFWIVRCARIVRCACS